ncbi:isochorismatase family protein [Chryseobacterium gambrini]|uniref:Isochorismatase family protein n=1 Tax=Chryseobacterium gambrini TaxID=373672 RepID=A0AAJ1VMR8_9FLAO|nr:MULTISPECIES: isochorismatase family protein [Chryseobacterium]MDN4013009.1 isochorismatase family protein [Chryseobacterium gambrini]MDN4030714.1 isochorismatase family protein [Chryseobacterium gambrini]QWA38679.1 isochorismatase family protein [Chryseobacterium sp. ZHDP1]
MNTTKFTSDNTALLLIDHQVGTMKLIKNIPLEEVEKKTLALAKMAKVLNIPVIFTGSQEYAAQGPLMPALAEILPEAFEKRIKREGIVNCWEHTDFRDAVLATGKKNLIMAGVTTDVCLVYPAISAVEEGFNVQAVMDASGSPFDLSEKLSQQRMAKAGVVLTATNTLMAEIAEDWARPEGGELLGILFSDVLPSMA